MRRSTTRQSWTLSAACRLGVVLVSGGLAAGCGGGFGSNSDVQTPPGYSAGADPKAPQEQYQLAMSYCCKTPAETRKALHWFCRAATQGHAAAQYEMANVLANRSENAPDLGDEFTDFRSAYMWYTVAAAQGHDDAFDARLTLQSSMSAEQVAQAKRWATRWKQASCEVAGL